MFLVLTKVFISFCTPAISRYYVNTASHPTDVGIPEVPWLLLTAVMAKPVDFHMTGARCTHMALELKVIAYMRFHTDLS